jgi:hypothetical protein
MNAMSSTAERKIATEMISLGAPSFVTQYRHVKGDYDKHKLGQNEHNCVTCQKHTKGVIPNNKRCNTVCNTKQRRLEVKTH